jgi:Protein of unknown function (DUF4058)
MPSPFPGMDPWLEHPEIFPDVHDSLISYLREALNATLPAPYFANIATRVWVEVSERWLGPDVKVLHPQDRGSSGPPRHSDTAVAEPATAGPVVIQVPHDEIREPTLEIRTHQGRRLVTSLEVLSQSNKTPGDHGRDLYLQKQDEILKSQVNLVEIDLLRGGQHTTAVPKARLAAKVGHFDYHTCVHRCDRWDEFTVNAWRLEMPLRTVEVPLLPGDPPVKIDLQPVLNRCYDTGHYDRQLAYGTVQPEPPLTSAQWEWAEKILRDKGLL